MYTQSLEFFYKSPHFLQLNIANWSLRNAYIVKTGYQHCHYVMNISNGHECTNKANSIGMNILACLLSHK